MKTGRDLSEPPHHVIGKALLRRRDDEDAAHAGAPQLVGQPVERSGAEDHTVRGLLVDELRRVRESSCHSLSMTRAIPWPTPMHIVASP